MISHSIHALRNVRCDLTIDSLDNYLIIYALHCTALILFFSPGDIPKTAVHYDDIGSRPLQQVRHHRLHSSVVTFRNEVEPNEIVEFVILPHLAVILAVRHLLQLTTLD